VRASAMSTDAGASADAGAAAALGADAGVEAGMAPLEAPEIYASLPVPGFADAVVSVPVGTTRARPVVVAIHGSGDRPDWMCGAWRWLVEDRAFVVCPRGEINWTWTTKGDVRYVHGSAAVLAKHIDAALDALAARYGAYVDKGPMIYSGFSLGASYAPQVVLHDPKRFPRLVMVEAPWDPWNAPNVRAFATGGGERVLFASGQAGTFAQAKSEAKRLEAAGIPSHTVDAVGMGHAYHGRVAEGLKREIPWLVEGDERWTLP
jgi:predicted esterase